MNRIERNKLIRQLHESGLEPLQVIADECKTSLSTVKRVLSQTYADNCRAYARGYKQRGCKLPPVQMRPCKWCIRPFLPCCEHQYACSVYCRELCKKWGLLIPFSARMLREHLEYYAGDVLAASAALGLSLDEWREQIECEQE
jgi:Helix-turn-helix domain of resolvase